MAKLEICCFNPESANVAADAGAHRIELCSDRETGGVTPPPEWVTKFRLHHPKTPVSVMIRPRGGNFVYTDNEFHEMKNSIMTLKEHADGFVFGILNPDKTVDIPRTAELVRLSGPIFCTFHKAFDQTPEQHEALEDVISTGCSSILTSGGARTASQGTDVLRILSEKGNGRIGIIAAGSIRLDNLADIRSMSGAQWIHSSALDEGCDVPSAADIKRMLEMVDCMDAKAKELVAAP